MRARALPLIALAAAGAVLAAGCGSSSSTSSTTAALTKPEFIKQADAICAKGNQEINKAGNKLFSGSKPSQAEQVKFVTDTLLPSVQQQIDGVRALTPPAGDEATITKFLDDAEAAVNESKKDPTSVLQSNGGSDPFAQANQEAKAYGLKVCGQG